ncbi:MAG: methyl-accepting chemotaxis protein [Spirochaetales bacterium]|nr:methyl-accepting chemotaxis protein [Spirochaetales bacterium]
MRARGSARDFRGMGLSGRFAVLSVLSVSSIVAIAGLFFMTTAGLRARLTEATDTDIPRLIRLQEGVKNLLDVQTGLSRLLNTAATGAFSTEQLRQRGDEVRTSLAFFMSSTDALGVSAYMDEYFDKFSRFVEESLVALIEQGAAEAATLADGAWDAARLARSHLEMELDASRDDFAEFEAEAASIQTRNGIVQGAAAAVFTLLNVLLSVALSRLVLRPLSSAAAAIHRLEEGDFATPMPTTKARAEMARLLGDVESLRRNLETGFGKVAEAAGGTLVSTRTLSEDSERTVAFLDSVETSNDSIREHMGGLGERVAVLASAADGFAKEVGRVDASVASQAEAVEAVRQALSTTGIGIGRTAEIFREEDQVVSSLRERTAEAESRLGATRDEIARLSASASAVLGLVTAIQDISERTNLLAMNAAIEAAHAGAAGKGFAVVSDEIRKLAESARGSSERITGTVTKMVEAIDRTEESQSSLSELLGFYMGETGRLGDRLDEKRKLVERLGADSAAVSEASDRLEHALIELRAASDSARGGLASMRTEVSATVETTESAVAETATVSRNVAELAVLSRRIAEAGVAGRRAVETLEEAMLAFSTVVPVKGDDPA